MSEIIDGALFAALSKAQAAFPVVKRDREVAVKTKSGGEYKFKYAPLDTILEAVRPALAANGLAIAQLIDGHDLVTALLHSDGGRLEGRAPLPQGANLNIQEMGSAITYLRRYSLQAILGIAAEEDDDGNAAAGNKATYGATPTRDTIQTAASSRKPEAGNPDGSVLGTAEIGKNDADFEVRQTPEGPRIAFRLKEGSKSIKVVATGPLAELIREYRAGIEGYHVAVWGKVATVQSDDKKFSWQEVHADRLKVGPLDLAAPEEDAADAA